MFGDPAFGRAGDAEEEEGAVCGEGGDGDLDGAAVADVFGGDLGAVGEFRAEEVIGHGPGGEFPLGRTRPGVVGGEGGKFVVVGGFGVGAEGGGGHTN